MGEVKLLPFPRILERPEDCLSCGYLLEGIPAPGVCPECGLGFDEGFCGLVFAGVAKSAGGPSWRRWVWIGIAVIAFFYGNIIGLLIKNEPWIALVIFLTIIASVIGMAMTNRQKGRGSELFSFVQGGYSRLPVGSDPSDRLFVAWSGVNPAVVVRRVSSVWASMKIVDFDESGKRIVMLEGGFRCPAQDLGLIESMLSALVHGDSIEDFECDDRFVGSVFDEGMIEDGPRYSETGRLITPEHIIDDSEWR